MDRVFPAVEASTFGSFRNLDVMQLQLLNPHYIVFAPPLYACEGTALCDSLLFLERSSPLALKRWSGGPAGAAREEQKKQKGGDTFPPSLDPTLLPTPLPVAGEPNGSAGWS